MNKLESWKAKFTFDFKNITHVIKYDLNHYVTV